MERLQSKTDYYYLMDFLGRGAFGEVVKSRKENSGENVAIKIHKNDDDKRHGIWHEIKMLNALKEVDSDKWNIIRFYEHFNDSDKFYLVFELLEQSLYDYQKQNSFTPLPIRHIRTITTQVLIALGKLQELSIMHTDLKPENIMLVNQAKNPFKIKLIDFGNACISKEAKYFKHPYMQTRYYRSPEILLGLPISSKIDMWSLGCIIGELHTGCPLYPGAHEYDQIRYIYDTHGMPKSQLLTAGGKTFNFFKKIIDKNVGSKWSLKSAEEYWSETKIIPYETRKYLLKSLDQLKLINAQSYSDNDFMAEYYDRENMVSLIKQMLTWDSHERISPNLAMRHPFISVREIKNKYENTFQNSIEKAKKQHFNVFPGYQAPKPSLKTNLDQMVNVCIEEPREVKINIWEEETEITKMQKNCSARQDCYIVFPASNAAQPYHNPRDDPVMVTIEQHDAKHSKVHHKPGDSKQLLNEGAYSYKSVSALDRIRLCFRNLTSRIF
ncbi:homeodomain-interacting protein kinase 4-like [Bombina bombina]|uniref:homeodomain-interacting protein kinase 4-like n=1 Tax=Bombina bombina TaxID=8345 RepID=UPI00235A524B|nr:homeodomain-interacting protein kinase 4-like [Bombina bombina]